MKQIDQKVKIYTQSKTRINVLKNQYSHLDTRKRKLRT